MVIFSKIMFIQKYFFQEKRRNYITLLLEANEANSSANETNDENIVDYTKVHIDKCLTIDVSVNVVLQHLKKQKILFKLDTVNAC